MDTKEIPIDVKTYNLRLKSATNCFDQTKVVNFTFTIKLMPKFHKYPISEERVYIGTTKTFSLGTFEPIVTEFTISIVSVSVSPNYKGGASLRNQI